MSDDRPPVPPLRDDEVADLSGDAPQGPSPTATPRRPGLVRRLAPAVVAVAVAGLLSPLLERWPSDHAVEVALATPAAVTEVTLTVSRPGEDPIHATTWNFVAGQAPERLRTTVHGPDGPYEILLEVARGGGASSSKVHTMDLDGARIAVVHAH